MSTQQPAPNWMVVPTSMSASLFCPGLLEHPQDTILVLLSDLYEGGNREEMIRRIKALVDAGVQRPSRC